MSRILVLVLTSLFLTLGVVACEDPEPVETESAEPIVGVMELPISFRHDGSGPSNAIQIEVSPSKMRVDGRTILELERGHVPDAEHGADSITKLTAAIAGGPARRAATLRLHANTPYLTTALIMGTLKHSSIPDVAFAVRRGTATEIGYMALGGIDVRAEDQDAWATVPESHQRRWDEFAPHWEAMHSACGENHSVDCAFKATNIAEGGSMQINLFLRGNAVKVELHRFGAEDPAPTPSGPELIDGVPSLAAAEEELPPAVEAAFTWRFQATTSEPSPVSLTMRELCGAQPCGVMVTAEAQTMSMRIASFLGAAFPNGTPAPHVLFQIPER